MKIKEIRVAIRKAKEVYGYVAFCRDSGAYVRLYKNDLLDRFAAYAEDDEVRANFAEGYLYVG